MTTPAASAVLLAVHLPLLRIDAECRAFGAGELWRMPFDSFDALTTGVFADHRAAYDAVAPVFYRYLAPAGAVPTQPLPADSAARAPLQIRLPQTRWPLLQDLGLGCLQRFHDLAADPAWLALLLEVPGMTLPQPRWSISFAIAAPGEGLVLADGVVPAASVRGDADVEYLLTPGLRGVQLSSAALARATACIRRLDGEPPSPPLQTLMQASSPLLGAAEQRVLATAALAALPDAPPQPDATLLALATRALQTLAHSGSPQQALHDTQVHGQVLEGSALEAPAGRHLLWAPLVGLQCSEPFVWGDDAEAPRVLALSGDELLQLETPDAARRSDAALRGVGERIATLALLLPQAEAADSVDNADALQRLARRRDLAVTALRLAGWHAFHDPALAGEMLMAGAQRWRRAGVLRQSIWQTLSHIDSHAVLGPADAARIAPLWQLLQHYAAGAGHADIDTALALYRRSFDRRFATPEAIAALQWGAFEALLGRCGAAHVDRVAALLGAGDAADWFAAHGLRTREAVAQGQALDGQAQAALDAINGAALVHTLGLRLQGDRAARGMMHQRSSAAAHDPDYRSAM